MVAARRIIALPVETEQRQALVEISRSRTEPANRVERARIILAYLAEPSAYAVARAIGVSKQTVTRCLACRRTGSIGSAGRPRAPGTGCKDYGGKPEPGLSDWLARSRRNSVTRTSCGPPVCWQRMRAITDRRRPCKPGKPGPRNGVQDPRRA
jgi:hypothetical protein